jgi:hypothetical protein
MTCNTVLSPLYAGLEHSCKRGLSPLSCCGPAPPFSTVLGASTEPNAIKTAVLSFLLPGLDPTWLAAAGNGVSSVQVLVRGKGGNPVQWSEGVQLLWQPNAVCIAEMQRLGLWDLHQPHRLRNQPTGVLCELLVAHLHVVPTQNALWQAATPVMTGCGGLSLHWHAQHNTMQPAAGAAVWLRKRRHLAGK